MRWSTPTISGTAATGHTLYAKAGSWTTGTSFAYQWLANGVAIPDATRSSYKPTPNVAGKRISVRVTGTKSGHTATSKISAVTARVMLTTKPTISGTAVVGSTVKASSGTWTPETRKTYQWYADGRVISGATSSSYKVSAYRKDQRLTVKVTGARDGYATATRTSSPTRYVQHPSTPTISGTLRVGYTLRAVPGSTWSADTSFTYQWYANGTAISGATSSKLTLRSAHKGKSIKVKVRGVKPGYTTVSKISASTTLVR